MLNFRLLRHLWYFSVVAEEKNFRRAADRLGISQPPLTQQIKVLENALQLKLLDRSRRQTQLTPQGAAILPELTRLIEQAERLNAVVAEARRGNLERITIGAVTSAILHLLPSVIEDLKKIRPEATINVIEMDTTSSMQALERNEIDLAIGRFFAPEGTVKVKRLVVDKLHVALPTHHALLAKDEIHITDLADDDWIHFPRRINPRNFDMVTAACSRHGFAPRLTHQVSNQLSQMAFVACGFGVALLPRSLTDFYVGHVEFRPLKPELEIVTAAAAWVTETPLIKTVVDLAGRGGTMRAARISSAGKAL
jgi:DNA-binding transcriptional LysR family regulator